MAAVAEVVTFAAEATVDLKVKRGAALLEKEMITR